MSDMKENDVHHFDPFMGRVLVKIRSWTDSNGVGCYRFSFEDKDGGDGGEFTIYPGYKHPSPAAT